MENILTLSPKKWEEYELLDSGNKMKLERFGEYITSRPDPRALWEPSLSKKEWEKADAVFFYTSNDRGEWKISKNPPKKWQIRYRDIIFSLAATEFKHLGVFPEQAANWDWISAAIQPEMKVLNLFAYTGGATLFAAKEGAFVTHVDSSKGIITWANENARLSKLENAPIRWIVDDAVKFVQREHRRGVKYDAIIMDPPRFGHGAKGEIWKIEKQLPELLKTVKNILSPSAVFFLINAYTADLSSLVLRHLLKDMTEDLQGTLESGELTIVESAQKRLLPSGIFARWSRKEIPAKNINKK